MIPERVRAGIFAGESEGDYNALFGYSNRQGPFAGVRVSDMTVNDVIRFTDPSGPYAQWVKGQVGRVATPVGAYQVVGSTLRDAVKGLGLTGNERFDQATQDAIGNWIYQTQGTGAWEGYRGPQDGGGAPMGLLSMSTSGGMPEQQPMTLGQRVKQNWQSGNILDALMLGFNSMRMNPDQTLPQMVQAQRDRRQQAEMANRTAAWLEAQGRPDLAEAVRGGVIDGASAFTVMNQKDERGQVVSDAQLKEMFPGAQIEPGLYNLKPDGTITKVGGGGTTISTADPLKIMPDGRVAVLDPTVEGGVRFVTPPGSAAATTAENTARANEQKVRNDQAYSDSLLQNIDELIGPEDGSKPGMITSGEGLTEFSNVGTLASKTIGWLQGPTNIDETIKSIKGQIVLERLQAMKDASATGASGMGTLTDRDVDLLASSIRALSTNLDAPTLRKNLAEIRRIWRQLNQDPQARALYYGLGTQGSAAPAAGGDGFNVTGQF